MSGSAASSNGLVVRIAVVMGGNSGIGAACAMTLTEDGVDIALLFHGDGAEAARVVLDAPS